MGTANFRCRQTSDGGCLSLLTTLSTVQCGLGGTVGRLLLPRLPLPLLLRQFSTALRVAKRRVGLSGKFDKCAEIGFQLFGLADNHLCVCAQPLLPVPPRSPLSNCSLSTSARQHCGNIQICAFVQSSVNICTINEAAGQRFAAIRIRSSLQQAASSNNNNSSRSNSSSRGSHWRELKG